MSEYPNAFNAKEFLKERWRIRRWATPSVVEISMTSLQHAPGPVSAAKREPRRGGVDTRG